MPIRISQMISDSATDGLVRMFDFETNAPFAEHKVQPVRVNTTQQEPGIVEVMFTATQQTVVINATQNCLINGNEVNGLNADSIIELISQVFFKEGGGTPVTPGLPSVLAVDNFGTPGQQFWLNNDGKRTRFAGDEIQFTDLDNAKSTYFKKLKNPDTPASIECFLPEDEGYLETEQKAFVANIDLSTEDYVITKPGIYSIIASSPFKIAFDASEIRLQKTILHIINLDGANVIDFNIQGGSIVTTKSTIATKEAATVIVSNNGEVYIK